MKKYNVLKSTILFFVISLAIVFHYVVPSNVMAYGTPYDAFGINEDGTIIAPGNGFGSEYPPLYYDGYQWSYSPYGYQQPYNTYMYQQSYNPFGYQQYYDYALGGGLQSPYFLQNFLQTAYGLGYPFGGYGWNQPYGYGWNMPYNYGLSYGLNYPFSQSDSPFGYGLYSPLGAPPSSYDKYGPTFMAGVGWISPYQTIPNPLSANGFSIYIPDWGLWPPSMFGVAADGTIYEVGDGLRL